MTGNRKITPARQAGKDVPQFAPNFTVYVLPPDVVCLYSEDRKFFLHGELYCAIAAAIAKGGKSFRELTGELEKSFPSDKIEEALKRLMNAATSSRHRRLPPLPSPAFGRALGYRPEWPNKISAIAGCAFNRST